MLVEIEKVRQIPGEDFRRWFTDANTDLIIWYDSPEGGRITGFQLCFDKKSVQRCLTWQKDAIGNGSILSADGRYSRNRVVRLFDATAGGLPEDLRHLVRTVLTGNNRGNNETAS